MAASSTGGTSPLALFLHAPPWWAHGAVAEIWSLWPASPAMILQLFDTLADLRCHGEPGERYDYGEASALVSNLKSFEWSTGFSQRGRPLYGRAMDSSEWLVERTSG